MFSAFFMAFACLIQNEVDFDLPYMGVYTSASTDVADNEKLPKGMYVVIVTPFSPASKAKLREGDIVSKIGAFPVSDKASKDEAMAKFADKKSVKLVGFKRLDNGKYKSSTWDLPIVSYRDYLTNSTIEEEDKIAKYTLSRHKFDTPELAKATRVTIQIGLKNGFAIPMLRIERVGKDVLYPTSFQVSVNDSETFEIRNTNALENHHVDIARGINWHWHSHLLSKEEAAKISALNKSMTVRINGTTFREDHELSQLEMALVLIMMDRCKLFSEASK